MAREKLKKGDLVRMNEKYYVAPANKDRVFTVRADERMLGDAGVVWLEEYPGCYAADGLTKIGHR